MGAPAAGTERDPWSGSRRVGGSSCTCLLGLLLPACMAAAARFSPRAVTRRIPAPQPPATDARSAPDGRAADRAFGASGAHDATAHSRGGPRAIDCSPARDAPPVAGGRGAGRAADGERAAGRGRGGAA